MNLKNIKIRNFRSIKNLELDFKPEKNMIVLMGKNGCGKSNILKAIQMITEEDIDYDKNCEINARRMNNPIKIELIFSANKFDFHEIKKPLVNILPEKVINSITLNEIRCIKNIRKIEGNSSIEEDITIKISTNGHIKEYRIEDKKIHHKKELGSSEAQFEILTREYIEKLILENCQEEMKKIFPKIRQWDYSEDYLIKEGINLKEFGENPKAFTSLKNLFNLCGINEENLETNLLNISNEPREQKNFSEQLTKRANEHLKQIWKEHKAEIDVLINGDECHVQIVDKDTKGDKNFFDMEQRSEGFKRFISFLLTISAENQSVLKNQIILIDEPENSLHPSAIENFRDELLELSQNNKIIVSTHSIFMIDHKGEAQHVRLEKEGIHTKIKEDYRNTLPFYEEYLLNSVGASLFKLISPLNILVEGQTDKKILDTIFLKILSKKPNIIATCGGNKMIKYAKYFSNFAKFILILDTPSNLNEEVLDDNIKIFELKDLYQIEKDKIDIEDYLPKEVIEGCYSGLFGNDMVLDDNSHKRFVEQIKAQNNNVQNLEELKTKIAEKVEMDFRVRNIANLKKKYEKIIKLCEKIDEVITKIKGQDNDSAESLPP